MSNGYYTPITSDIYDPYHHCGVQSSLSATAEDSGTFVLDGFPVYEHLLRPFLDTPVPPTARPSQFTCKELPVEPSRESPPLEVPAIVSLSTSEGPVRGGGGLSIGVSQPPGVFNHSVVMPARPLYVHFGHSVVAAHHIGDRLWCNVPPAPGPGQVVVCLSLTGMASDIPCPTPPGNTFTFTYRRSSGLVIVLRLLPSTLTHLFL